MTKEEVYYTVQCWAGWEERQEQNGVSYANKSSDPQKTTLKGQVLIDSEEEGMGVEKKKVGGESQNGKVESIEGLAAV